jgi:eukaryotic-like serine/threonine-protein kinase
MMLERWQQIERLYHAALERDQGQRTVFLNDACAGDPALRREVESLLAHQETAEGFMQTPAMEVPANMVTENSGESPLIGKTLGVYKILSPLGAGGMGEVYRARDPKLGRDVAVKVLPPSFGSDPERVRRFEREARILAALNHPHIAAIYGFEEANGVRGLVLELVEGPTLADRLVRGPLSVTEAVSLAKQICEALEAAHEKGIIHRDLKPANIKITAEGTVKVLDFGLAKAWAGEAAEIDPSQVPTITATVAREGVIMGTPAYMSPEQARGLAVDKRTDIWAFGCVLFEMLSGQMTFSGKTVSDTIAAILEREPAWDRLPDATPPAVRRLLRRCLEKDTKRRWHDVGDLGIVLQDLFAAPAPEEAGRKPPAMTRRTAIGALFGAAAGAAATGVFSISRYRGAVQRNLTQFAIMAPEAGVFVPSFNNRVAISPDGARIAFNAVVPGADAFYMRSLAELESKRVKEVPTGGVPFFSPDGRWVGFITAATGSTSVKFTPTIQKMALSGGAPITLCPHDAVAGLTWADDDTIYWVDQNPGGISGIPAAGGQPKEIFNVDFAKGERQHKYPCALPGGKAVLATVTTAEIATFDEARIVAFVPRTGQRKVVLEGGTQPRYSSGYLLYARDGKILAVHFDPDRLEVQGQPFTVLEGVQMSRNTGVANFDVSASGDLAYIPGICDGGARSLVWVDRSGKPEPVPLAAKSYLHPRLSPDDRRLAIEVEGPSHDLYVYDFDRGVLANITTDGVSHWPVWSPDGRELGYRSGPMGHFTLWHVPADRSQKPQRVQATGVAQSAESWSPDGRTIVYTAAAAGVPPSIMVAPLDSSSRAELVSQEKAPEGSPKFSPDGRWLAYCSNESGKPQVYVQAFPGPGPKIQISNDGGTDPVWKKTGGELYYRNGDSMMAVAVSTASGFTAGRPQELWKGHYSHGMSSSCGPPGATSSNYDVTADGKRFLMIKDDDQDRAISREIVVALGWSDELSRLSAKT